MINLFHLIDDPLYRLAIWVLFIQLGVVFFSIIIVWLMRVIRPRLIQKQEHAQFVTQEMVFKFLSKQATQAEVIESLSVLPKRYLVSAFEHLSSRLGQTERDQLRSTAQVLQLEEFALNLSRSWFWWRRLEGVLLLGSIGSQKSEADLTLNIHDKEASVAFHAAWALVRISPIRSRSILMHYLQQEQAIGLSFVQRVRLMREFSLDDLNTEEIKEFFQACPERLKPELIEAVVLSSRAQAKDLVRLAAFSPSKEVRIAAFKSASLSRFDLRENELLAGIKDPEWEVRAQAVKVVGEARTRNLIPQLVQALTDYNWWVRQNASRALAQMGDAGISALRHVAAYGGDPFARDVARLVLAEVLIPKNKDVRPDLKTAPFDSVMSPLIEAQQSVLFNPDQSSHLNTFELKSLTSPQK